MTTSTLPKELKPIREAARRAIGPLRPTDENSRATKTFLFDAQRTEAGRDLPPYYLVYFLLVDLLGFKNLGRWEKLAWSVPVDFGGEAFLIEHRKAGVGVFARDAKGQEAEAREIVALLRKGVKAAQPYFEWVAGEAVARSDVNVVNHSAPLFHRFEYFLKAYRKKIKEATRRASERHIKKRIVPGGNITIMRMPAVALREEAKWLALAAIESFYSWTEHVFIHLAILTGVVSTGQGVADLAKKDWQDKFKAVFDLNDPATKVLYDKLVAIRRQLRNFIAHGSFGKQGEAFRFHSSAGAVPVVLPHQGRRQVFTIGNGIDFVEAEAIETLAEFVTHVWSQQREPARRYIQDSHLPLILTMARDGQYARAMASVVDMNSFLDALRGGPDCLNRFSASISGASAGVRLPGGGAAG